MHLRPYAEQNKELELFLQYTLKIRFNTGWSQILCLNSPDISRLVFK